MTALQQAGIPAATSRYGADLAAATDIQRANIAADSAKVMALT